MVYLLGSGARHRGAPATDAAAARCPATSALDKGQEYLPTVARIHERMLEPIPGLLGPTACEVGVIAIPPNRRPEQKPDDGVEASAGKTAYRLHSRYTSFIELLYKAISLRCRVLSHHRNPLGWRWQAVPATAIR